MGEVETQSHSSMIVGSGATVTAHEMDAHGVNVIIEDEGGIHRLSLAFFDALPLMTLANVLHTDEAVRRFVSRRPDAEREVLVSPKFTEAMRNINGNAEYRDLKLPGIDDPATHPAQPPEPTVLFVGPLTANVRCLDCGRDFMSTAGATNLERLASATLGYAAHWAREHGR